MIVPILQKGKEDLTGDQNTWVMIPISQLTNCRALLSHL